MSRPSILRGGEDLEADDLAVLDSPEVTDADLDLDAAGAASSSLTHRYRHAVSALVEPLRLDRELIETSSWASSPRRI